MSSPKELVVFKPETLLPALAGRQTPEDHEKGGPDREGRVLARCRGHSTNGPSRNAFRKEARGFIDPASTY